MSDSTIRLPFAGTPNYLLSHGSEIAETRDILGIHEPQLFTYERHTASPAEFHVTGFFDEAKKFKEKVKSNYDLKLNTKQHINYFAIIRTATPANVILKELKTVEGFYQDKNVYPDATFPGFVRLGNKGSLVIYYCPVFKSLSKYTVDFGLKVNQLALDPTNKKFNSSIRFDRAIKKKTAQEETTKILPKVKLGDWEHVNRSADAETILIGCPGSGFEVVSSFANPGNVGQADKTTVEFFDIEKGESKKVPLDYLTSETANVPNSKPVSKLTEEEKKEFAKSKETLSAPVSVPVVKFNEDDFRKLQESCKVPAIKVPVPSYIGPVFNSVEHRKAELPLEGRELEEENCIKLAEELRNEYKKIEEQEAPKPVTKEYNYSDKYQGFTVSENYHAKVDGSVPVSAADYETKARAFGQLEKSNHPLPKAFVSAVKGFYKKESNEADLFNRLSDDSILVYKIGKLRDYANKFNGGDQLYSKTDLDNMVTHRVTYVKHNFLAENQIPFVLVNSLTEYDFNFYGHVIADKQQLQDKIYTSLYDLVNDLKDKAKNNLIFVKNIPLPEYYEALTPSLKFFSEYKIKCYFLPKNQF